MKKMIFCLLAVAVGLTANGQDVVTGLNAPAYGVRIKANFPNANGGWARGYYVVNQDNSSNFLGMGVMGMLNNGISTMNYGWIGQDWNNSFISFLPNGFVGIGTTNPSVKLEVNVPGTARSDGGLARFLQPELALGSDASISFGKATGTFQSGLLGYQYGQDGSLIYLNHWGDSQGLVIKSGGNVGIGTITPAEKLSVNGKIRAKEVKVEATNWPDYVFDQDYKVLGLQELDAYIKVNKHLPDMPSAKSIESEGLAVGDMLKLQQKKIEELTLHLIEKDKALKAESAVNIENQKRIGNTEKELAELKEMVNQLMKK